MSKKQNMKEIELHRRKQAHEESLKEVKLAYGDNPEEEEDLESQDISDDWEQLRAIAINEFPEGSKILGLTSNQRLTAIAHCLGWSNGKIAKAGKISPRSVGRWLKRPDVLLFIKEYGLATNTGNADFMAELGKLEYSLLNCMKRIATSDSEDHAIKRLQLDAFKSVIAVTRGTKSQVDHRNNPTQELAEILRNLDSKDFIISDEEAEDIFESTDS